jgi:hypothetical protein
MEETPGRDARPGKVHRGTPARAFHQGLTHHRRPPRRTPVRLVKGAADA